MLFATIEREELEILLISTGDCNTEDWRVGVECGMMVTGPDQVIGVR